MAGNLINTLYPPIAETFMPAFVNTQDGYILFSLSPYNENDSITRIHISLVDQKTNKYAFKNINEAGDDGVYIANGIMIRNFSDLTFDEESGLYYCPIEAKYLRAEYIEGTGSTENAHFKIDTYYQVQVRLDNFTGEIGTPADYLLRNRQYFSEWSRVILLRPIPEPIMYFNAWDTTIPNADFSADGIGRQNGINGTSRRTIIQENFPAYNPGFVSIAGRVYWESASTGGAQNTEYLDNYRITVYSAADIEVPILQTPIIYVGNQEKDSIYYLLDLNNEATGTNYIIHIDAETRNGYQWWDERTISLTLYNETPLNLTWEFTTIRLNSYGDTSDKVVTEEDGFVRCKVSSNSDMPPGYLYIYRSSSVDNYKKNEIIQVTEENGQINESFEDKTVCSLIQYKYKAQYKLKHGSTWTKVYHSPVYVYPDFYDMLLLRQDKQLAIRFDEQISSFKPMVNRVKIDTIGNKYPKFAENARMNYKQFQISGYISAEADFNRRFLSENDDEFAPSIEAYDENIGNIWQVRNDTIIESTDKPILEGGHDTYLHDNWYWEREFREKALQWLNDGEPKLFRSMTEGNMIVMLTDINLTPNRTLGRRLYTFTAVATEIADGMNYDDLVGYGIIIRRDDEADALKGKGKKGDEESSEYTLVERISQYILPENKNLESGSGIDNPIVDLLTGQILRTSSPVSTWVDPITILDSVNQQYTGVLDNRVLHAGSIRLNNLKIQFNSKPRWMLASTLDFVDIPEGTPMEETDMTQYVLGYKFKLKIGSENTYRTIFVNPKGYYQIPSDLSVSALLFYYGDAYQLDYILSYQLEYNTSHLISRAEKIRDVVGQHAGMFYPGEYMGETIRKKYSYIIYKDNKVLSEEFMSNWSGISFDVTPYAVIQLLELDDTEYQERLVGRTGVYNLMTDFPVKDFKFDGRRMVKALADNRPYLDEWEYVLDKSVLNEYPEDETNYWYSLIQSPNANYGERTDNIVYLGLNGTYDLSEPADYWGSLDNPHEEEEMYGYLEIKNIKNPQYNTIYKLVDANKQNPVYIIYYIDQGWYQVIPYDDDFNTVLARVPIYGNVNYRGTVIKQSYS